MPASKDDGVVIYTRSIRLKNGKRIFAHQYGKRAFRIVVRSKRRS